MLWSKLFDAFVLVRGVRYLRLGLHIPVVVVDSGVEALVDPVRQNLHQGGSHRALQQISASQ